jgi:lysine-ketoglutarate reductase/saccharopine dehydrogenase-like protein (TIGR00300 family)
MPDRGGMTRAQATVVLDGHIIDSLILPKILDTILALGGTFDLTEVRIGTHREEASHAKILVRGKSGDMLAGILRAIQPHGAVVEGEADCAVTPAPSDGVLPENFYATSHLPTQIRLNGRWIDVEPVEMDVAIRVTADHASASTVPMADVAKGDLIVTGREGVRVFPLERPKGRDIFSFMQAEVSSERPSTYAIADIAERMRTLKKNREAGKPRSDVLLTGGPAIIHAGGRDALAWLIDQGYIHVLFCGNALATHDLEAALFGTSLGYGFAAGHTVPHGHEHHLRTINRIRAIGSIARAVETGVIKDGVMAACVRRGVKVVMAGSIRDDGPLPGVITDVMQAQAAMRAGIQTVGLALLVATTLHAVATGNLMPATIPTVCVDVNPAVPTKLADRGTFQAIGLVMDAASFLRDLARQLGWSG